MLHFDRSWSREMSPDEKDYRHIAKLLYDWERPPDGGKTWRKIWRRDCRTDDKRRRIGRRRNVIFVREKAFCRKNFDCREPTLLYHIAHPQKVFGKGKQEFAWGVFLIQREVGEKIMYDAKKKSFLRRLLNYAYEVKYLKTVSAKAFSPPPKVQSCVIGVLPKKTIEDLDFDKLYSFLDAVSGFKRKTLGKINKILKKKDIIINIPQNLKSKRLEELTWENIKNTIDCSSP